jgi:ankyrin repeat protein
LIKNGHPIDLVDNDGNTPLQAASISNGVESAKVLVKYKANY